MKKIILFSIMLLLSSSALFAQNLSIGVKHGINNTGINFKYDDSDELLNSRLFLFEDIKNIINIGVLLNYSLGKHFSLQAEVNYLNRGFEFQSDPMLDGGRISGNYKTTYFSVPLLACYELGKTIKVYGYGGIPEFPERFKK